MPTVTGWPPPAALVVLVVPVLPPQAATVTAEAAATAVSARNLARWRLILFLPFLDRGVRGADGPVGTWCPPGRGRVARGPGPVPFRPANVTDQLPRCQPALGQLAQCGFGLRIATEPVTPVGST